MPHEPASDLLPAASDVLPDECPGGARGYARHHKSRPAPGNRRSITKASLKALVCPPGKSEAFYWDSQVPGFGLRAYAGGRRVWLLQYRDTNGKTRRLVLGDVKALDPEKARDAARAQLTQRAVGNDPAARRRADRHAARMSELVQTYLAHHAQMAKASTLDQTRRNLTKYAARLHAEPVAAVDRATVHRLHKALTTSVGPVQANRTSQV